MKTMEKKVELSEQEEARKIAQSCARDIRALYNADLTAEEAEEARANGEDADIYDYLSGALDVEYTLDSRKQLIGVTVYVGLGGPSVWIDTRRNEVRCHWGWGDAWAGLDADICDAITSYYEEIMEF